MDKTPMYGFVYVVTGDIETAKKIARVCVSQKLVACANIIPSILSFYKWEGEFKEDKEVVLLLKTRKDLFNTICSLIKQYHSYQCPCIVWWPFSQGYPPFLSWIDTQLNHKPTK